MGTETTTVRPRTLDEFGARRGGRIEDGAVVSSVPACNGLCVPSADIDISAADGGIAYPHPACDEHNLFLRAFEVTPGDPAEWEHQLRAWHAGKPAPLVDSLGLGRVSDAFLEATIVLLRLRSAHLESVSAP